MATTKVNVSKISDFPKVTPAETDQILVEKDGQGGSITLSQIPVSTPVSTRIAGEVNTLNSRIDNIVASSGDDISEIVDARQGSDGTNYASLRARLDAENNELKGDLVNLRKDALVYPNMYNNSTIIEKKVVDLSDGNLIADNSYHTSDYIKVQNGRTYTSKFALGYYGAYSKIPFYNSNKEYVGSVDFISKDETTGIVSFIAPNDGYVRIVLVKWDTSPMYYMSAMFVEGNVYPTEYKSFNENIYLNTNLKLSFEQIVDFNIPVYKELQLTVNNYYMMSSGVQSDDAFCISTPIRSGEKYVVKSDSGSEVRTYVIVKSDGTVSRYSDTETWHTYHNYDVELTITEEEDNGTLYVNSITSTYIGIKKEEIVLYYPYISKMFGKTAIFDGDSICASSTDISNKGAWAGRICDKNHMQYKNYAVSGGTITNNTGDRHWVCSNVDTMYLEYPNADYIIFEGGTNDADILGDIINGQTSARLGTYDDKTYKGTFDTDTFCGALETIFQKATTYWRGKKIGFVIAFKMGKTDYSGYTKENKNRRAYFEVAMKICEKWGIPYLNLWDACYMNPSIISHYDPDKSEIENVEAGSLYLDGQHPTPNGYEYFTPIIESWMETL